LLVSETWITGLLC